MSISKQIGWSQESNLLWNISSQLDRLTKVIANLSPGGGGVNIYNSDGTLTGNRVLNGANNDLNFNDLNSFAFIDTGLAIGMAFRKSPTLFLFGGIDYGNKTTLNILDYLSKVYFSYQGNEIGLKLDFANSVYQFGDFNTNIAYLNVDAVNGIIDAVLNNQNQGISLDTQTQKYKFGVYNILSNIYLEINSNLLNLKTFYLSNNNGLNFDFPGQVYQLGQITGANTTHLTIDDGAPYPVQLSGTNISANTAGAASGQFLKIKVGGVDYKIALLNP